MTDALANNTRDAPVVNNVLAPVLLFADDAVILARTEVAFRKLVD